MGPWGGVGHRHGRHKEVGTAERLLPTAPHGDLPSCGFEEQGKVVGVRQQDKKKGKELKSGI